MSERQLEDRWFAYFINAVDAHTEDLIGLPASYDPSAGLRSFLDVETLSHPSQAIIEARQRGVGYAAMHYDFEWKV